MIALLSLLFIASQAAVGLFLFACFKLAGQADQHLDQMSGPPWSANPPDAHF